LTELLEPGTLADMTPLDRATGPAPTAATPHSTPAQAEHRALRRHRELLVALAEPGPQAARPLDALGELAALRTHLDQVERQLIHQARDRGTSWARIATALGLASRQAAEQRLLRLTAATGGAPGPDRGPAPDRLPAPARGSTAHRGPAPDREPGPVRAARRYQRTHDTRAGRAVGDLRAAVLAAGRRIDADPDRAGRHPRTGLARATLTLAGDAPPGALVDLATLAVRDLDGVPPERLGPALRKAVDRLRQALAAATPTADRGSTVG
jgi:hypothetical protein